MPASRRRDRSTHDALCTPGNPITRAARTSPQTTEVTSVLCIDAPWTSRWFMHAWQIFSARARSSGTSHLIARSARRRAPGFITDARGLGHVEGIHQLWHRHTHVLDHTVLLTPRCAHRWSCAAPARLSGWRRRPPPTPQRSCPSYPPAASRSDSGNGGPSAVSVGYPPHPGHHRIWSLSPHPLGAGRVGQMVTGPAPSRGEGVRWCPPGSGAGVDRVK
jgi:hypothetical protein